MHKDYEKLLTYSFRLLSKKRYTVSEIEKKLTQYSKRRSIEDNNLIEKVINRLFELRYLNDQEYCNDFVNSRIKFKPRGKYLLKKELMLKGLSKNLIETTLSRNDICEIKIAEDLLSKYERKWSSLENKKRKEKAFQLLSRKGFSLDSIYKTLDKHYNLNVKVES